MSLGDSFSIEGSPQNRSQLYQPSQLNIGSKFQSQTNYFDPLPKPKLATIDDYVNTRFPTTGMHSSIASPQSMLNQSFTQQNVYMSQIEQQKDHINKLKNDITNITKEEQNKMTTALINFLNTQNTQYVSFLPPEVVNRLQNYIQIASQHEQQKMMIDRISSPLESISTFLEDLRLASFYFMNDVENQLIDLRKRIDGIDQQTNTAYFNAIEQSKTYQQTASNIKILATGLGMRIGTIGEQLTRDELKQCIDGISQIIQQKSIGYQQPSQYNVVQLQNQIRAGQSQLQQAQLKILELQNENKQLREQLRNVVHKNNYLQNDNTFYKQKIDETTKVNYGDKDIDDFKYRNFVLTINQESVFKQRNDFGKLVKDLQQLNNQLNSIMNARTKQSRAQLKLRRQNEARQRDQLTDEVREIYDYFMQFVADIEEVGKIGELNKIKGLLDEILGLRKL